VSADGQTTAAAVIGKGHSEIAVGGPGFSGLTPLTTTVPDPHRDSVDIKPAFSPDGKRIAFMSDRSPAYTEEQVWEGPFRPYRPTQASCPQGYTGGDDAPVYTPDGASVIFVSWLGGQGHLDRVLTVGRGSCPSIRPKHLLAIDGADVFDPDVAQDGKLVFVERASGVSDAATAGADGTGVQKVTTFGDVRQPVFSPDGTSIIFISAHGGSFDLWSVGLSGKDTPQRLTWGADIEATSRPAWVKG
jgi:Tol biopolymer transport system component